MIDFIKITGERRTEHNPKWYLMMYNRKKFASSIN